MKVSLNWIKEFTKVDLPIDTLVEKIGAQLGAVEEVIDLGKKYQGTIVAKVISCQPHANADKLKVCTIDDRSITPSVNRDENGHIQVVCGAPNVREGLMVAWLPPGTTVPSTYDKDPLVLEAREIRGVVSNGMLASAHELGISDDHSGILELNEPKVTNGQSPMASPEKIKPGDDFAEVYKLNDYIIDIENKMFTHRPDLFGQLGVAREIAGITGQAFTSPEWYLGKGQGFRVKGEGGVGLEVKNEVPGLVPRYMAVAMDGIKIGPSPIWLQSYLSRVGIRPINNIVDITNYMMMLTGQPLHAFDFDKIAVNGSAQIVVRKPRIGEKITLLGGKEIEPRADAVLICNQDKPIALGGIMGGNNSEVDENTTRIVIECATFDMYNIRKTAMEHGLFTDAVTRFIKGQSPLQNDRIIVQAAEMVFGASSEPVEFASELIDDKHLDETETMGGTTMHQIVQLKAEFINARLGLSLSDEAIIKLLENVEFSAHTVNGEICIQAPFWRTDIEIPEDIVEEVGRLYGYDHLPLELPKRDLTPAPKDPLLELKSHIRQTLSAAGANELLTYSFVHGNLLDKVGQDRNQAFQLANALSPDLQYYRLSLTPSLLEKVHPNIKAGHNEFALFEIGKTHTKEIVDKEDGLPYEFNRVALAYVANDKSTVASDGTAYYQARAFATHLLSELGISNFRIEAYEPDLSSNPLAASSVGPFASGRRSAILANIPGHENVMIGVIGEFTQVVSKSLKLPKYSAGFELEVGLLGALQKQSAKHSYAPLPRFPKVEQDICLKVSANMSYQELYDFVQQKVEDLKPEQTLATLEPIDIYQRDTDKDHKQITLRLSIASYERTLTDDEINKLLDQVAAAAKEKFGAERI